MIQYPNICDLLLENGKNSSWLKDLLNFISKLDLYCTYHNLKVWIGDFIDQNWYILTNAKKSFTGTFSYRIEKN